MSSKYYPDWMSDETMERALEGQRATFRVALWGIGVLFLLPLLALAALIAFFGAAALVRHWLI